MKKNIVIPTRLNSSNLPNKILLDLKGETVVQRVYEQFKRQIVLIKAILQLDKMEVNDFKKIVETITY